MRPGIVKKNHKNELWKIIYINIDAVYYVKIVTSIPKGQFCKPRSLKNEFVKYCMFIYKWKLLMYKNENLIKHKILDYNIFIIIYKIILIWIVIYIIK